MQWKREYKNRLHLKCLKFHNVRGWVYALKLLDREKAKRLQDYGWRETRAKNHMLVFNDPGGYGRLEWHVTGRINIWIRKPANWGKVKQLLAGAFFSTGLISDIQVFDLWANSVRFKGAHIEHDTGERLPYARIDFLKDSLGVIVKTGDVTHPTCVEIEFVYPDWAERNERILEQNKKALESNSKIIEIDGQAFQQFNKLMADLAAPKPPLKADRSIV